MSTIKCNTLEEFITCCALLVRDGILFEADAARLTITLTGGC